jgi:hypothetical protein
MTNKNTTWETKIADIFGFEKHEGNWVLITRDEYDELQEFVDYDEEVKELSTYISQDFIPRSELVERVRGMFLNLNHGSSCEFQRPGCDCGYMEKVAYNQGLNDFLGVINEKGEKDGTTKSNGF